MLYVKEISTDANTIRTAPKKTVIKIWRGVIHSIDVLIPAGHKNLCRLQIKRGNIPIMPTNEDGYISGDDSLVQGKFFHDLKGEVNTLTAYTWNLDDAKSHTFIVRIGVLPKWYLLPIGAAEGIVTALRSLFVDRFKIPEEHLKE